MNSLISSLSKDFSWLKNEKDSIVDAMEINPSKGTCVDFPDYLNKDFVDNLKKSNYIKLFSHQLEAIESVYQGNNTAIVTGTASGKSLCYQIPIINSRINSQSDSALLLFPTKALSNDQNNKFQLLINKTTKLSLNRMGIYDGDTSQNDRRRIIDQCNVIFSNPDMLHLGILPHHTTWQRFFRSLKYVVLDEIHYYKGIFGSHVANVIRRLNRICSFYDSHPVFILTSATIGNSEQHAEALIGQKVKVISNDGSPHGAKTFLLLNPPIIDKELGIRKSNNNESIAILESLLSAEIQTILFTITRRSVELLLKYFLSVFPQYKDVVFGYRSGYLAKTRREIEEGIRNGEIKGIISTNALELGIDIGGLGAVIINGYPGSISSILQQLGRAGRHQDNSISFFVASLTPMDQYLMRHPQRIIQGKAESIQINPDNPVILLEHIRAAVFELPISHHCKYGSLREETIQHVFSILEKMNEIYIRNQKVFWLGSSYPASDTSLRNIGGIGFSLIVRDKNNGKEIIGTVDESSVYWMVHPNAIYLHEGNSYCVNDLNVEKREVILHPCDENFFTIPIRHQEIEILNIERQVETKKIRCSYGSVLISQQVTGYKKIRWGSQEILGFENLDMPITELETSAYWFSLKNDVIQSLLDTNSWNAGSIDYGPEWKNIRNLIRLRDHFTCQYCGVVEGEKQHQVHHKIPFRNYSSAQIANSLDNLITLCPLCHRKAEVSVYIRSGLTGLSFLMHNLASLFVQCELKDLGVSTDIKIEGDKHAATIFLHDMVPGGIGLSDSLYTYHQQLLQSAYDLVVQCSCLNGCPSCIGPIINDQIGGKKEVIAILKMILE